MAMKQENNHSIVRVSGDGLRAYLTLYPPEQAVGYTVSKLEEILEQHGVVEGIARNALVKMINNSMYDKECLVAEGRPAEDGQDGRFEFHFKLIQDTKPKILPDGSVDYGNMKDVAVVEAGEEIVVYKPAIAGHDGIDVYGKPIIARVGRELVPLKGKGFYLSEDKRSYTAKMTGKAEYVNERLTVSNMITIDGDVTILTGDIRFAGDVFVKGNVVSGMVIEAKGSITVNGHVEGARLIAGKDVVLRNGMQGSGKGEIQAGRDVSGKFFEQVTIYAKGSVRANAILNCHIMSEQEIIVSGKKGVIVGGITQAIRKVEATMIGNMAETRTRIDLGVDRDVHEHLSKVKIKQEYLMQEVNKIEEGIQKINRILERVDKPELAEKKLYLMRAKIEKDTVISTLQHELEKGWTNIVNSQNAKLVVNKSIYRGARLTINGVCRVIESENYNVTYYLEDQEISFKANI